MTIKRKHRSGFTLTDTLTAITVAAVIAFAIGTKSLSGAPSAQRPAGRDETHSVHSPSCPGAPARASDSLDR